MVMIKDKESMKTTGCSSSLVNLIFGKGEIMFTPQINKASHFQPERDEILSQRIFLTGDIFSGGTFPPNPPKDKQNSVQLGHPPPPL